MRHLPRALASEARGLQPGVTARCSFARVGGAWRSFLRCESACARARSAARFAAQRRAKFSSAAQRGLKSNDVRSSLRRAPVGEGAEAHDLQPGEVFGLSRGRKRAAACRSTTRRRGDVFLGACRRGRRLGSLNHLQVYSLASWRCLPRRVSAWAKTLWPVVLSTSGVLGRYWAAQWHLARAVGKRFRGCRAKRLYVHS